MSRTSPILLVEDSDEDYETTMRAFKKVRMANQVIRCEDGDQALDYLFRRGIYKDALKSPRPSLILLDLNLPGTDGRAVLEKLKKESNLRMIPVVILTTSSDQRDIDKCYSEGANSFVQKPVSFENFVESLQRLKDFWFEIVLHPDLESEDS
ncbi:MAG: response regulator [Bdellovibrionia bacterium]